MATNASRGAPLDDDNVPIELDEVALTSDRATQYQDWAERMRAKREQNQKQISNDDPQDAPTYWRAEYLFADSDRASAGRRAPSAAVVQELLGVLGLSGEPSANDVEAAYRRLAKVHHPDRHVSADEPSREYHLDQMRRINEAYARLRQLELP